MCPFVQIRSRKAIKQDTPRDLVYFESREDIDAGDSPVGLNAAQRYQIVIVDEH